MKTQANLRAIFGAAALLSGIWLSAISPSTACPFSQTKGVQGLLSGNFPSLSGSWSNFKNVGSLSAGIVAGVLVAGGMAYQSGKVKKMAQQEEETSWETETFTIPVYSEVIQNGEITAQLEKPELISAAK
jgi:hypothetical protein